MAIRRTNIALGEIPFMAKAAATKAKKPAAKAKAAPKAAPKAKAAVKAKPASAATKPVFKQIEKPIISLADIVKVMAERHELPKAKVKTIFDAATLPLPEKVFMQTGGKTGTHTEHLGYILAELQYVQRTYPNSNW